MFVMEVCDEYHAPDGKLSCWWWLRSPGYINIDNPKDLEGMHYVSSILSSGTIYAERVTYSCGVRPAFKIRNL